MPEKHNIDMDMAKSFISNLYHTHFNSPSTYGSIAFQHIVPKNFEGEDHTGYIEYARTIEDVENLIYKYAGRNCYITVNEQINGKGKNYTLLLNAFYIDLDDHDGVLAPGILTSFLSKKFEDGTLPRPDIRVKTGRGEGHFFLLGKPIFVTERTEGLIKVRDYTYRKMFEYYRGVLAELDSVHDFVDASVATFDRYCRIPGTLNMASGSSAELLWCEQGNYEDINAVRKAFRIADTPKKKSPEKKQKKYFHEENVIEMSQARLNGTMFKRSMALDRMAEALMEAQGHSPWGEVYLFWKYNTLRCFQKEQDAKIEIMRINDALFGNHYGTATLAKIFRASEKVNIYKIRTAYLIDKFGLSFEDAKDFGFGDAEKSVRKLMDEAEKEEKKKYLLDTIREFRPKYNKAELLTVVNVMLEKEGIHPISINTLGRRLKELGLEYKRGTLAVEETAEYRAEERRKAEIAKKKIIKMPRAEFSTDFVQNLPKNPTIYLSAINNEPKEVAESFSKRTLEEWRWIKTSDFADALAERSLKDPSIDYEAVYAGLGGIVEGLPPADILDASISHQMMTVEQAASVKKFVRSLYNENRNRAYSLLRRLSAKLQILNGQTVASYADIDAVVYKKYGTHLPFSVPYKPASAEQKEHFRTLESCRQLWNWIIRGQGKTERERAVVGAFKDYNALCRQKVAEKCGSEMIPGLGLSYRMLKSVVLFRITVDDIRQLAAQNAETASLTDPLDVIRRMAKLVQERNPSKFQPSMPCFSLAVGGL